MLGWVAFFGNVIEIDAWCGIGELACFKIGILLHAKWCRTPKGEESQKDAVLEKHFSVKVVIGKKGQGKYICELEQLSVNVPKSD